MNARYLSPKASENAPNRRTSLWIAIVVMVSVFVFFALRSRDDSAGRAESRGTRFSTKASNAAPPKGAVAPEQPLAEESTERKQRPGVDGSNFYKNAFALLRHLSEEDWEIIKHPAAETDPERAAKLFEKLKPIMELLYQGAAADYCDWALGPMDLEFRTPYLRLAQELAGAARWVADYCFATDPEAALRDLGARARLGSDVSETTLGFLVSASFEHTAIKLIAQNAGYFTPEALDSLRDIFGRLHRSPRTQDTDSSQKLPG